MWRCLRQLLPLLLLKAAPLSGESLQLPTSCEAAAVGAGWSGVYYAFRLASAGVKVCIFEASQRVGGRTYSHRLQAGSRNESFTVDVGAYRFSPDMHLPGDLILDVLGLPVACYEPDCPPAGKDFPPPFVFNYSAPLVRIVDTEGMPAGYVSAIEGLLAKVEAAGGQLFLGAQLTDLEPLEGGGAKLTFGDQGSVDAKQLLLNLPRSSLLGLPTLRNATPARTVKMEECTKFDLPTSLFPPGSFELGKSLSKAYAFYEDAWWHTALNKTQGQLPTNAFEPVNTSVGIPIGIHFNDGPVRCNSPLQGCRGFLEVFYSTVNEDFFEDLKPSPNEPLGVLSEKQDNTGKLSRLHAAVMEATRPLFAEAGKAQPKDPPTLLVVGIWDRTGHGFTAPTKVMYSADPSTPGGPDPLEKACGVPGLTEDEYRSSLLMPVPGNKKILVANNDWIVCAIKNFQGDWAEESLLQAERGLRLSGFERPEWLDEDYYKAKIVAFTDRQPVAQQAEELVI